VREFSIIAYQSSVFGSQSSVAVRQSAVVKRLPSGFLLITHY